MCYPVCGVCLIIVYPHMKIVIIMCIIITVGIDPVPAGLCMLNEVQLPDNSLFT